MSLFSILFFSYISFANTPQSSQMMFNEWLPVEERWRVVMLQEKKDESQLLKASRSKDWFLRDASLRRLTQICPQSALARARELLTDPSLLVRTTAVKSIAQVGSQLDVNILMKALQSPQNFHHGKSLWVRKHLVIAIARLAHVEQKKILEQIVNDKDSSLHSYASAALIKFQ